MNDNDVMPTDYEPLYNSILLATTKESEDRKKCLNNKSSRKKGDHTYFFLWLFERVLIGDKKIFEDDLKAQLHMSDQAFGNAKRNGFPNCAVPLVSAENRAKAAFELSYQYSDSRSLVVHLAGYINKHKLELVGTIGHEPVVETLLHKFAGDDARITDNRQEKAKAPRGLCISWERNQFIKIEEGKGTDKLWIDNYEDELDPRMDSHLLGWQYHLTQFMGRVEELKKLENWLTSKGRIKIQLMFGEMGTGKSRLAFYFAEKMTEQGWRAGQPTQDFSGDWSVGKQGILFIIDDAEERRQYVEDLMHALNCVDRPTVNIRVLILGRNIDILRSITQALKNNREIEPISVPGFQENDNPWALLKHTWGRLHQLAHKYDNPNQPSGNNDTLPFDDNTFKYWLEITPFHTTPLMIMGLAIYLSGEIKQIFSNCLKEGLPIPVWLVTNTPNLIRHMTEIEIKRVKNEVKIFNESPHNHDVINYRHVLLVKAMAAITDGLDNKKLILLKDNLNLKKINLPPIQCLKELSLWNKFEKQISPVKPDILAADFYAYCLNEWAEGDEAAWVFGAWVAPQEDKEKLNESEFFQNASRLEKLVGRALRILNRDLTNNSFEQYFLGKPIQMDWLITCLITPRLLTPPGYLCE